MVHWAAAEDLVVASTLFPRKDIYKMTWKSPDDRTFNQIDHVLISRRFRTSITNVRTYRGADVDTDHFLVCAEAKLKLKRANQDTVNQQQKKFDTDKLKDPQCREEFCLEIRNRFSILNTIEDDETDIEQ